MNEVNEAMNLFLSGNETAALGRLGIRRSRNAGIFMRFYVCRFTTIDLRLVWKFIGFPDQLNMHFFSKLQL